MELAETVRESWPPDPLRRFVATPFRATFQLDSAQVCAETNDPCILMKLCESKSPREHPKNFFRWKLVRESEINVPASAPLFLHSGPVVTAVMGPACLIAVDYEKSELLAFLGSVAIGEQFDTFVLPLMCDLTQASLQTSSGRFKYCAVIGGRDA